VVRRDIAPRAAATAAGTIVYISPHAGRYVPTFKMIGAYLVELDMRRGTAPGMSSHSV
jgi:hypothetical protein